MVALIAAKIAADLARQGIGVITEKIAKKNAAKAAVKVAQILFPFNSEINFGSLVGAVVVGSFAYGAIKNAAQFIALGLGVKAAKDW